MKLLIINGPNINLLGLREPQVYGHTTYGELTQRITEYAESLGIATDIRQYNSEGDIIDTIHAAIGDYDALILNPGAYTHYSYAIHDALKAVPYPTLEIHLSNIAAREEFRRISVTAPACVGQISGLGIEGYFAAIRYFHARSSQHA